MSTSARRGDSLRAAGVVVLSPLDLLTLRWPELSHLLPGRVDDATAANLALVTGVTKEFWLNAQASFDGSPEPNGATI